VEHDPPVRYFLMGGGTGGRTPAGHLDHGGAWRTEQTWPPPASVMVPYFPHADGSLRPAAPEHAAEVAWQHDPEHPVPSIGAAVTGYLEWVKVPEGMDRAYLHPRARMRTIVPDGPMHQRERPGMVGCRAPFPLLAARADVVVFQTPVLDADVALAGAVVAELYVSSSAVDTDVTVKLVDVYPRGTDDPDGFQMGLVDTILRGRFRDGIVREDMMAPGEVYLFRITLPPVANLFKAGHRIRLDVASSNFPRFDVNPGTGEPLGRHTRMLRAQNTLHVGRSRVLLPICTFAGDNAPGMRRAAAGALP
jgi:predicted acyl esterase